MLRKLLILHKVSGRLAIGAARTRINAVAHGVAEVETNFLARGAILCIAQAA